MWFGIRTSNGRKWRKSIPLADNKHCYVVVVVYLLLSEDDSAILTGFQWYNFEKKIFEHTFQNHNFRPLKIRGFGLGRTRKKFADSDANSESVTTLLTNYEFDCVMHIHEHSCTPYMRDEAFTFASCTAPSGTQPCHIRQLLDWLHKPRADRWLVASQYTFRWQPVRISMLVWVCSFTKPDVLITIMYCSTIPIRFIWSICSEN